MSKTVHFATIISLFFITAFAHGADEGNLQPVEIPSKPVRQPRDQQKLSKIGLFLGALLFQQSAGQAVPGPAMNRVQMHSGEYTFHEYKFDPQHQKVKIAHCENGDLVRNFVRQKKAEVGINGGFWNDVSSSNTLSFYARKLASRWGYSDYIPSPAGILEVDNQIIADSGAWTPALGWTNDGKKAHIGELVSAWWAQSPNRPSFPIGRVTALNQSEPSRYLYLPSNPAKAELDVVDLRVEIDSTNRIVKISDIDDMISPELTNSYRAIGYSAGDLKPGDIVKIEHKYISDIKEFEDMDYVINGGKILVKNSKALDFDDSKAWSAPRTAVCLRPQGEWSLVVTLQNIYFDDLAKYLENAGCESAISLDGGPSSNFVLNQAEGLTSTGNERLVSDAIVVMPAGSEQRLLPEVETLLSSIKNNQPEIFLAMVNKNPELMESMWLSFNPIALAIERYETQRGGTEILKFLLTNADVSRLDSDAHRTGIHAWPVSVPTLLWWAIYEDLSEIAEILIRRMPSLLKPFWDMHTQRYLTPGPIEMIIHDEQWNLLRAVLEVSPESLRFRNTHTAYSGIEVLMQLIAKSGSIPEDISSWAKNSSLEEFINAIKNSEIEKIKQMVGFMPQVLEILSPSHNPIALAIKRFEEKAQGTEIIDYLIDHYGYFKRTFNLDLLDEQWLASSGINDNPLRWALWAGLPDTAKLLIERKPSLLTSNAEDHEPPIYTIIRSESWNLLQTALMEVPESLNFRHRPNSLSGFDYLMQQISADNNRVPQRIKVLIKTSEVFSDFLGEQALTPKRMSAFISAIENHQIKDVAEMARTYPEMIEAALLLYDAIPSAMKNFRAGKTDIMKFLLENSDLSFCDEQDAGLRLCLEVFYHAIKNAWSEAAFHEIAEMFIRKKPSLLTASSSQAMLAIRFIIVRNEWNLLREALKMSVENTEIPKTAMRILKPWIESDYNVPEDIAAWVKAISAK